MCFDVFVCVVGVEYIGGCVVVGVFDQYAVSVIVVVVYSVVDANVVTFFVDIVRVCTYFSVLLLLSIFSLFALLSLSCLWL